MAKVPDWGVKCSAVENGNQCDRQASHGDGLCNMHHNRMYRNGTIFRLVSITKGKTCKEIINIDGKECGKKVYAKEMCKNHYELNHVPIGEKPRRQKKPFKEIFKKLTREQVIEIKIEWARHKLAIETMHATSTHKLSEKYGVSAQCISLITNEKIHKKISGVPK